MDIPHRTRFEPTDDILATKGQRFTNFIVDILLYYALCALIGIALGVLSVLAHKPGIIEALQNMGNLTSYLLGAIILTLFFFITEALTKGRTLGKFITGTVVVDRDGLQATSRQFFIRSICRVIPFEPFSFLGSNRGWHDRYSDTYVVVKRLHVERMNQVVEFDEIGERSEVL
jgi:uncharacterized RDD family membrane protein YckC